MPAGQDQSCSYEHCPVYLEAERLPSHTPAAARWPVPSQPCHTLSHVTCLGFAHWPAGQCTGAQGPVKVTRAWCSCAYPAWAWACSVSLNPCTAHDSAPRAEPLPFPCSPDHQPAHDGAHRGGATLLGGLRALGLRSGALQLGHQAHMQGRSLGQLGQASRGRWGACSLGSLRGARHGSLRLGRWGYPQHHLQRLDTASRQPGSSSPALAPRPCPCFWAGHQQAYRPVWHVRLLYGGPPQACRCW